MESKFCTFVQIYGAQTTLELIQCHMRIMDLKREYQALNAIASFDTKTIARLRDICGEIAEIEEYLRRFIRDYQ